MEESTRPKWFLGRDWLQYGSVGVKRLRFGGCYPAVGDATLLEALSFHGGNEFVEKLEILLRAGVAALLNASHPGVDYNITAAQVIADVNAAIDGGDADAALTLATQLDVWNNQGCDITSGNN